MPHQSVITALIKPSKQTQLLLDEMFRSNEEEKTRWDSVMDNFELLYARLNDIGLIQQDLKNQLQDNMRRVDNVVSDQKLITKQVKANGQAVAQLTLRQFEDEAQSASGSSVSMIFEEEAPFTNVFANDRGKGPFKPSSSKQPPPKFDEPKKINKEDNTTKKDQLPHHVLPKMPFPQFARDNPKIWLNKCTNYFSMYSIPEDLWVTIATMHLQDNAAMWWEAYKLTNPTVTWANLCQDIQSKFGSDDYRTALAELIALKNK